MATAAVLDRGRRKLQPSNNRLPRMTVTRAVKSVRRLATKTDDRSSPTARLCRPLAQSHTECRRPIERRAHLSGGRR